MTVFSEQTGVDNIRLKWFARAWSIATLFHLAALPSGTPNTDPMHTVLSILLAGVAGMTLLFPQNRNVLLFLCLLIPVDAWAEAPFIGNHWVLAALVSLTFCLASLYRGISALTARQMLLAARTTLLIAYSFAAFAKLNWDFLNPAVSCVTVFQERLVNSWGLPGLGVAAHPGMGHLLAITTIVIELSVATLLAMPRTRRVGLLLAFGFHWALALDLQQHFWDFSSVLFAGFLLFMDDGQVAWIQKQLAAFARYKPAPPLLTLQVFLLSVIVAVLRVLPEELNYGYTLQQLAHSAWWVYGTGCVLVSLFCFLAPRANVSPSRVRIPALLWVPPALAALNGLTPYLELKTGFGWNMYSNLRTVAGQSNHLLVPATLDLLHAQREPVRIVRSSDPVLQRLHDQHYALAYSEFVSYAYRFPDAAATYTWRGQTFTASRLGDDPAAQAPFNTLALKLWSYRLIDLEAQQRCQPSFTPAR